jgi:hypothetical protein
MIHRRVVSSPRPANAAIFAHSSPEVFHTAYFHDVMYTDRQLRLRDRRHFHVNGEEQGSCEAFL